jgi:hypothetical protein
MARRSSGKGTHPVSTAIDLELFAELQKLANRGGITVNKYCRIVIQDAVSRGVFAVEEKTYTLQTPKNLPTIYSPEEIESIRAAENPTPNKPGRAGA